MGIKRIIKFSVASLIAASMVYGSVKVCKKPRYYKSVAKETFKICLDSLIDNPPRISQDELYIDLHMHIKKPEFYPGGIEEIVDIAMRRVDVVMIMHHNHPKGEELDYETFIQEVKKNSKYGIIDYGKYAEIKTKNDRLIAVKAQELTNEKRGDILAIGCDNPIKPYRSLDKIIEDVHQQNGIAIIAHPMSKSRDNLFKFGVANEEELKELEKVCYKADAIEEFNSNNILWMYRSNVLAELFAEEKDIAGVAGSDTHYDLEQIGLSGIIVKTYKLDMNNFIGDLRKVIKNKEFRVHKEYNDPIRFKKTILIPFIKE